ncbi:MAG: deoxyribonuclease IV [Vicinamibacterales bacterium]
MPFLGAHMSVAGGLPRAIERAVAHDCRALQIFSKNASQWRGRPLPPEEVHEFRQRARGARLHTVVSHASYLINLAAEERTLAERSLEAMRDELDRADALGLMGVVLHPGCHTASDRAAGLTRVAQRLGGLLDRRGAGGARILIEHTAGQGTSLGACFEEIAAILREAEHHPGLGVCLDTCHLLAAGYDIATADGYARTFDSFERVVGLDRLKVFHLNDSKKPVGSRVDRHEHIGKGYVGLGAFERLLNDSRFAHLPMLLETPKGAGKATGPISVDPADAQNLRTLRELMKPRNAFPSRRRSPPRSSA